MPTPSPKRRNWVRNSEQTGAVRHLLPYLSSQAIIIDLSKFPIGVNMSIAVENEFKLTTDKALDEEAVFNQLCSFLDAKKKTYVVKKKHSVDRYYDNKGLYIYNIDSMVRLKNSSNGKVKLTLKRTISKRKNMMSRKEIERPSDGTFKDVQDFAREEFPGIKLLEEPIFMIECLRYSIKYTDKVDIDLAFDRCTFMYGDHRKEFHEIELEFLSDYTNTDFDEIGICKFINKELGFEPVTKSKYQRGVEWRNSLE